MLNNLGESTDLYTPAKQYGSSGHSWTRAKKSGAKPTPGSWSYGKTDKNRLKITDADRNVCTPIDNYTLYSWHFHAEKEMEEYIKEGRIYPGPVTVDCIYYRNDSSPDARGGLYQPCLLNATCNAPLECSYPPDKKLSRKLCLLPNGTACEADWQCISGKCRGSKCGNKYQVPYWLITIIIITIIAAVIKLFVLK